MKRDPSDTDRTYRVESCEHGVAVFGLFAPTDDVSALMRAWSYRGLRYASLHVAKRLGALVAVTESAGTAGAWIEELDADKQPVGGP